MSNPNIPSNNAKNQQEQPAEMGFDPALDYLVGYASNDLRGDAAFLSNIIDARNGGPNALDAVIAAVKEEQTRLGGGDSGNEIDAETLNNLNRAQNALEKHKTDVEDSAKRAEDLDHMRAMHEQQRPQVEEEARKDAHEAIDRQPPPKKEFNDTADELAKKFGTDINGLLNGISYDDMFQKQPELVRTIHNLNADYL
jgi:hypothetical protein